jgi:hypothetical protein
MECEMDRLRAFTDSARSRQVEERAELNRTYAYACPDTRIIHELAQHPVVELGAGTGYWARLIQDSGGDITALDNWRWPASGDLWFPVGRGDETMLADFVGRTLLIVMPPRPGDADRFVRRWRGDRLVVVTRGRFPIADDPYEETSIDDGGWQLVEDRHLPEAVGVMVATTWIR